MPEKQLRRELVRLARSNPALKPHLVPLLKTAASSIPLDALLDRDPGMSRTLAAISRVTKAKQPDEVFSGLHGVVLLYQRSPAQGSRFKPQALAQMAKIPGLRWVEFGDRDISFGVDGPWIDAEELM